MASNPYSIQFEQLSLGLHAYDFELDQAFFSDNNLVDFLDAKINVDLELDKQDRLMTLSFNYSGSLTLPCDRCNEAVEVPLEGESTLIVKFGQTHHEDHDELIVLDENEHQIDLSQHLYESVSLLTPLKRIHADGACDPAAIEALERALGNNEQEEETDPRWNELKRMISK